VRSTATGPCWRNSQQRERGQNSPIHPLFREVFGRSDGGVTAADFDGVRRIFGFTRLAGTDARILIGLDEAEALRRIDREIGIAYLQLALFGILTLLAAWYGASS